MPDQTWPQPNVSVFVPYVLVPNSYLTSHDVHRARVLGRLAPGATLAQAERELNAIKRSLEATYPASKHTWGVTLQPMRGVLAENSKPVLLLLFGAVAFVLFAALSIHLLNSLSAELLPATMIPQLDLRVLAFSLLASCGTGLLFGIFPAWRAGRPDLNLALKSGSRGSTDGGRTPSQSSLVIAEVALTAILLVGTGLLLRGMVQAVTADPGFEPKNVLTFGLTMPFNDTYQGAEKRMAFLDRSIEEIRTVPGVVSVATTDDLPFGGGGQGYSFSLEELPETRQERSGAIKYVSPGYFDTMGAKIVRGRTILPEDNRADSPRVLVVNQTLADGLFGEGDPIGRQLNVANETWEIIGVAADMRADSLLTPPRPTMFAPQWQFPWGSAFLVRTQGDPQSASRDVAAAIHRLDPSLPLANLLTLERAMKDSLGPRKLILNLIGAFAAATSARSSWAAVFAS